MKKQTIFPVIAVLTLVVLASFSAGYAKAVNFFSVDSKSNSVGNLYRPTISVLYPNGGEEWETENTETIMWQDSSPRPMYIACSINEVTNVRDCHGPREFYDISLVSSDTLQESQVIARSVSGYSYDWAIPRFLPSGSYIIQICKSGTAVCGSSDNSFNIIPGKIFWRRPVTNPIRRPVNIPTY